jgi:hypothetical protein
MVRVDGKLDARLPSGAGYNLSHAMRHQRSLALTHEHIGRARIHSLQAMNLGNHGMSETSDIPYHSLEAAHQQYLRLSTLKNANDRICNFIAGLAIFPHYSFDLEVLYGSVDGQKFEAADPTIKARYSRKHFGRGKGVVAYTLLANHVALQTELIGAQRA